MALQPIIIGAADAKQGDSLFTGATKINANFTELYNDVSLNANDIADNAQEIIDTIALIDGFTKTYWFYANDTATASNPIVHGAGSANTFLTNDAIGSRTTSYNPDSRTTLWNPLTNKFDFTTLKIGDVVEFRVDLTIANGAAQEINLLMSIAETSASPYELNVNHAYYKTAATGVPLTALFRLYIGDEETRTGSARFRISSADAATIIVDGWFYQITNV